MFEFNKIDSDVAIVPTLEDKISNDTCWCCTFNLVWNDLKNTLVKGDIVFNPEIEIVKNLNKESFKENMLSSEYYYKIYGPKTLELKKQIENEIKKKFNQKSDILDSIAWDKNNLDGNIRRYFFYTMLYRKFEYKNKFDILKNDYFGNYKNIKYFGISTKANEEVRNQIEVLFYDNENEFAIKLITKTNDEVIFYKKPNGNTFKEVYEYMIEKSKKYLGNRCFEENDKFKAPIIELDVLKEFAELENKPFRAYDGNEIIIENAIQTIKFALDEKGGTIKSEATIGIKMMSLIHEEFRKFEVNDTFVIFVKEIDKGKPYLALKINDITKFQK